MTDQPLSQQPKEQHRNYGDDTRTRHGSKRRMTSPSWLARAAAIGLSGVSVLFVLLFIFVLKSSGKLALITQPLPMQFALALPYLVVIFTLNTVLGTVLAWWKGYWTTAIRVHQTVIALLGLGFSWQLAALGFLSLLRF